MPLPTRYRSWEGGRKKGGVAVERPGSMGIGLHGAVRAVAGVKEASLIGPKHGNISEEREA